MDTHELNKKLGCTGYAVSISKSHTQSIAECLIRMGFASSLVEERVLDEELYKNFVNNQKAEIKDSLAYIYSYLHLNKIKGHADHVFTDKKHKEQA